MATYRITDRRGRPFVQIDKTAMEDSRLSWKARGLLAYLLSKPDDWKFHRDTLAKEAPDGLDSVKAGIKELEKFGYVKRYPTKEKGKIVSWNMDVFEIPYTTSGFSTSGKTSSGKSTATNNVFNNNDLKDINNTSNGHLMMFLKAYESSLKEEIEAYLQFFYSLYYERKEKPHPRLKEEQLLNVYETFDSILNEYGEALEQAIRDFFTTIKKSDHNINHFVSPEIIVRLCERNK